RVSECRRVEVQSQDASTRTGFQNRFAVSAKTNRAVNEETSSFRNKELQCLLQQHGTMGRAYAPQRRSNHHRPVISFKDLTSFALCCVSFVLCLALHKAQSTKCKALNTKPGNRRSVLFCIRIGEHARPKLIELPNFEIRQIPKHRDVANNFGALAKQRVNQQAALSVDRRLLSVVIRSIKELAPGRVHRWQ